jgi:hypothetical protein
VTADAASLARRPAALWIGFMAALPILGVGIVHGMTYSFALSVGLLGLSVVAASAARHLSSPGPRRRFVAPIFVGLAAVAIGYTIFGASVMYDQTGHFGRASWTITEMYSASGFDALTGEPRGRVYTMAPSGVVAGLEPKLVREPPPPQIADRWAIPVWVGAVGTLLVAAVIRFVRRRV